MTLYLNKPEIYADAYRTNLDYIKNMTSLQMKPLKEMKWNNHNYIHIDLEVVPWVGDNKKVTKGSSNYFLYVLHYNLMEL